MDYKYQARNQRGDKKEGVLRAVNEDAALRELQKQGLYVVSLVAAQKESIWKREIVFKKRVNAKDIAAFSRQFAVMIKSNIPIVSALRALASQNDNPTFRDIILNVAARVEEGLSLSRALAEHPKTFSKFFISVVQSGEASGRMGDSLEYLADHLEREYKLKSQIKGAMIYPIFILVVAILAFVVLTIVVIPNLVKALEQFEEDLPAVTHAVLGLSELMTSWFGLLILGILVVAIFLLIRWFRSPKGRTKLDAWILKLPLGVGDFFQKFYLTRFSQNLSVLVESGLPISEALKITGEVVGNSAYHDALERVQTRVIRGERISTALKSYPKLFHPFIVQMIEVGEQTGQLGSILIKVVDFYQDDVSRKVDNITSLIEPILILIMGGLIGFLVLSIFLPIFTVQMAALGG